MTSFQKIWESSVGRDFWDNAKNDEPGESAKSVVMRGLEIRPDRANTFWDDFISVICNNSDDAADLLGVSKNTISSWTSRIKKVLEDTEKKERGKSNMLQTGVE